MVERRFCGWRARILVGRSGGVCDLRSGVLRSFGIAGAIRREVGED